MTPNLTTPDRRRARLRRIRIVLALFMIALVLSGLTAIPVEGELDALAWAIGLPHDAAPQDYSGLAHWIAEVRAGVRATGAGYPYVFYGYDWLAFGHIAIAVALIGPLRDPVRNRWVLTFGMIACVMVIPWALCVGPFRGIPLYWSLVDCSFGVFGIIPLALCRWWTRKLAKLPSAT
jgi:hypothetical protein